MGKKNPEILAYITKDRDRVISGDPLTLYISDEEEQKECVRDLGLALQADVVQLRNGDYILVSNS